MQRYDIATQGKIEQPSPRGTASIHDHVGRSLEQVSPIRHEKRVLTM